MPSTIKSVLRHLYKSLVGDSSASTILSEAEIDTRVATLFELEEPGLGYNFRNHYSGQLSKFEVFWEKAKEFLEEDVGTALDDRRHSMGIDVAKAFSVRDLPEKVTERCIEDTTIPSDKWICLQFSPVCLSSYRAL